MHQLDPETISIVLELGLVFLGVTFTLLILGKYLKRKKPLQFTVFLVFAFIVSGIFLVWVSRVTYYSLNVEGMDPNSFVGWIMYRVGYYRFTFILITISSFFAYRLDVAIFQQADQRNRFQWVVIFLGFVNCAIALFLFDPAVDAVVDDLIAFGVMFIHVTMIYARFMYRSFKLSTKIMEKKEKSAIHSLGVMALCFILTVCFFLLDRVWIMATGTYYSMFYYMADVALVIGIISAYLGYIRPSA